MRIVVNTRLLIENKLDGIGWFTFETLKRITRQNPDVEFVFVFDRPFSKSFVFADNVIPYQIGPPARHPFLWYLWFQNSIPRVLNYFKPDLFLSTDGFLSLNTYTKQLPVIHDLNFEHYPNDLPFFYRKYYRYFFSKFAEKATRVATVSEFSKQDIMTHYNVPSSKIDVVYNGCNEDFNPISEPQKEITKKQLSNGASYFLFIGNFHPRKNIARMLKAFELFKRKTSSDYRMVLVGNKMWWDREMENAYANNQFKHHIILAGRRDASELKNIIGAAFAMLYLSYFEGFGIPVLEGMRAGIPVLAGNLTAIPEVGADAVLYADPFSEVDMAEKMTQLYQSENYRNGLVEKGLSRAAFFSWDNTANQLWRAINKCVDVS